MLPSIAKITLGNDMVSESISITALNYVKEMFEENMQNINIWTDCPFSQFKNKFVFIYIYPSSVFSSLSRDMELFSYKSWKGGCEWSWRHHNTISYGGNHIL